MKARLPPILFLFALLGTAVSHWIDPDSPTAAHTTTALMADDRRRYRLVFSDEFERDGRTFADGADPRWTALHKNDLTNNPLHYYSAANAYTQDGRLVLRSDIEQPPKTFAEYDVIAQQMRNQTKQVRSAMMQSWNKFCFTGGIVEFSAKLPGKPYTGVSHVEENARNKRQTVHSRHSLYTHTPTT